MKLLISLLDSKNIKSHKLAAFTLATLSFIFFKPFLLLTFPGLALVFYLKIKKVSFLDVFFYTIVLSLSFWICGFWFLKFIPISLTTFIYLITAGSIFLILFKNDNNFSLPKLQKTDFVAFSLLFLITLFIVPFFQDLITPSGADMATHTYVARLIVENNSFPKTYEPILSVNNFGSSPVGGPIIIAITTLMGGIPIYTASLIYSFLIYGLLVTGVFIFIKNYFGNTVSFLTTFTIIWVGEDVLDYIDWGGNNTIFSLALLIFCINFLKYVIDERVLENINALCLGILFYASFSTHFIPPVVFSYWTLAVIIAFPKYRKVLFEKPNFKFVVKVGLIFSILLVPFLFSMRLPSSEDLEYTKNWQSGQDYTWTWHGNISNFFYTIPKYMRQRTGILASMLSTAGLILSLGLVQKHKLLFQTFFLLTIIIVINSHYWFLPLSPILYPDRTITVSLIPMSFFIGIFYKKLLKSSPLAKALPKRNYMFSALGWMIFLSTCLNLSVENFVDRYDLVIKRNSVTRDDLDAIEWLSKNTTTQDVIKNNYGDAGIWIPGIAYRRIVTNDLNLLDIEPAENASRNLTPTYAFIGSKVVYNDIEYTAANLDSDPNYQLVYSSGNARVYKIKN